jgi:signal peptidase I
MTTENLSSGPARSLRGSGLQLWMQRAVTLLWLTVVPALLAVLVMRFLIPPAGNGFPGVVARIGHGFALPLGALLFFLFSAILRYWRFRMPGGRYASALPAHLVPREKDPEKLASWAADAALYEVLVSAAMRRRLERSLDPAQCAEVDFHLSELRAGLELGDAPRARMAACALASAARVPLVAHRRREAVATAGAAAIAALAALGIRGWVAQPYRVLSSSMLPTFEPDDLVAGNKIAYAPGKGTVPRRGEVIAFQSSSVGLPLGMVAPEVVVKRVIGLPGDRVSMKGNQPIINGWPVPHCDAGEYVFLQPESLGGTVHGRLRVEFLDDATYLTVDAMAEPFRETYECKPGEIFVLGDNRGNSLDSRAWNGGRGGGVPVEGILAGVQWFLTGTHHNGDADFGRFGRFVDGLQVHLRVEGMDDQTLRDGIARCMASRPADTHPPRASEASGARASREIDP